MDLYYPIYVLCRGIYQSREWMLRCFTPLGFGVMMMAIFSALLGLGSSQSMCHLLFFLSLALLALALIGRRFIQFSFTVERFLPRFGTVGEALHYRIALKNTTVQTQAGLKLSEELPSAFLTFPEFLKIRGRHGMGRQWFQAIQDELAKRQWAIAPLIDLSTIGVRGKTDITGAILPLRRGRLNLDNLMLKATDPLGLSYQCVSYEYKQSVCILPQRYQLPLLFSVNNRAYQMGDAVLTSAVGESLEFRALRDYRPGDPTNKIHWKSWAKVGRPVVREQQDESTVHHGLLLDTFCPEPYSDVFEEMLAIATSIVTQTPGDPALLEVLFASQDLRCITSGAGTYQKEMLLEMIATMSPCQTHRFQDLIPLAQSRFSQLSSCVCLLIQWDSVRQTFLENLAQYDIPTKAIVICEGQQSHEGLRFISLSQSCTVYFISLGQIQQDLLQI